MQETASNTNVDVPVPTIVELDQIKIHITGSILNMLCKTDGIWGALLCYDIALYLTSMTSYTKYSKLLLPFYSFATNETSLKNP